MAAGRPSSGWIKGIVKEVVSGDTLTIASGPKLGAPEKRITLASLIAPKLGKRDGSTQDEDFAWESRSYLRKLCIGKTCTFRVDYTLENIPGREFGSVFVGASSENVALRVVADGWAKVREGKKAGAQSPYMEQLLAATKAAETQKKGIWSQDKTGLSRVTRSSDFDPQELLDKVGKGKPIAALVEQIGNGSTLRVTLLDNLQHASVQICGVQCPAIGRRAGKDPETEAVPPQPFALEARHFSEMAVLNREVRILLQGVDKHDNLIGSIVYPSSDGPDAKPVDLGKELLDRGLAKIAEWGLQMMITGGQTLREAERKAKQGRTGIWHDYVQPASAGTKLSDDFKGIVVEVVSGDLICVKDSASGVERRVTLSSIRAPKSGGRDRPGEPLARESKEFLRQRLIGREVQVSMEYSRKVPLMANGVALEGAAAGDRQLDFGSVLIKEEVAKKEVKLLNVAAMMLQRGLASIVKHRTDDERSAHYEVLLEAEQTGMKNKKGLHKKKEGSDKLNDSFHVNDISHAGNANKAKQHLAFLTRAKQNAVVEAVLSGNRLKLYIEKEGIMLVFSPSGVRAPQRPQQAGNGRSAVQGEAYWEEALNFTRHNFLQREVEVEVETVDRGGSFLGSVTTKGPKSVNLGLALLSNGLAKLHPSFEPSRVPGGKDLAAAEARARDKRLKVWEKFVPQEAAAANGDSHEPVPSSSGETIAVTVTDLIDANNFSVQKAAEPRVSWISEQMQNIMLTDAPSQPPKLKQGDLCLAVFSLDKQLYRAKVEFADNSDPVCPTYSVLFIDFGNREKVKATQVRPIDPALRAVPAQAHQASLAYIKVKGLEDEVGNEAARLLNELIGGGRELSATVVLGHFPSPQSVQLLLTDKKDADASESINARLLSAGLARFQAPKHKGGDGSVAEALQAVEQAARKEHVGMWQYGDPGDESDEETDKPKNAWGRR